MDTDFSSFDPEVLAALPADIRKELEDQCHSAKTRQETQKDFLDALPQDIRAEVIAQQQQQLSTMEVDSQQASLRTPTRSSSTDVVLPSNRQKRQRIAKQDSSAIKHEP